MFSESNVVHVPSVAMAELMLVLRRLANNHGQDGNEFARSCLRDLMSRPGVQECQEYPTGPARQHFYSSHTLSYVDAVGIALALHLEQELVTLDERQRSIWVASARPRPKTA